MAPGKVEKGMRKGTKSCLECRKRKIRCIFNVDDTEVCVACRVKGKTCVEQKKSLVQVPASAQIGSRTTLEERVAQLEALIRSRESIGITPPNIQTTVGNLGSQSSPGQSEISQRDKGSGPYGLATPIATAEYEGSVSSRTDIPQMIDPVESIFNNAVWKQKESDRMTVTSLSKNNDLSAPGTLDQDSAAKAARVCDQLCKGLPSPRLMASILGATSSWWSSWRAIGSWLQELTTQRSIHTLQEFVSWALASSEPPFAALGILCLATSIQQLDYKIHDDIIRQLPRPPGELFHEYFDRVNGLIINHNGYCNSRAGVEVLMMSAKILMNLGLLKMTWLLHHRAISHAQLLGLHRHHQTFCDESTSQILNRHDTWFYLCQNDLYTSLLLGLPYATDGKMISAAVHGTPGTLKFFFYRLARLSARIIDRNQMGNGTSVPETRDIERDVDAAAAELTREFWDAPASLSQGKIERSEYMERLGSQFWFFQMKVLLHQPLMIQSIDDQQLLHNRTECLIACRETLKIYHLMRSDILSAFGLIKMVDYQAFICSAILLLGLLGYGMVDPVPLSQAVDHYHDSETVQATVEVLRHNSSNSSNSMASQAVQGLDTLIELVKTGRSGYCATSARNCPGHVKITIPGSGIINIAPGEFLKGALAQPPEKSRALPPPIFHLSHDLSQDLQIPELSQTSQPATENNSRPIPETNFDIPTMDFDWTNMIDMDLADDWAWLADVNAGVL